MSIRFTCGDKEEAISVMREAAQWLIDIGKPMWDKEDISPEKLNNHPDEFLVMWDDNDSVAALILSFEDKFFWPDIPPNKSGFIHKLSVKRKYAGTGYAKMIIEYAKKICLNKGIIHLRLDCDSHRNGLIRFYNSCGFTLVDMKIINTKKWGKIDLAMYEMELNN